MAQYINSTTGISTGVGTTSATGSVGMHNHTVSTSGQSGPSSWGSTTSTNMTLNQKTVDFSQTGNSNKPTKGDMKMDLEKGRIQCYDGTDWNTIAGEQDKLDLIRAELRELWPEVLFDLVMKDLL